MTSPRDPSAEFAPTSVRVGLAILLAAMATGCSSSDAGPASNGGPLGNGGAGSNGPEPTLPAAPADCPVLATGAVNVLGQDVQMWVGEKQADKKGPIVFYWHGTGSVAAEAQAFMANEIQEVQDEGGVFASFGTTLGTGTTTGNNVWYTGDYDSTDVIVACAVKQLNIDTHRIYAAGCSAGGLQAGSMVFARSSYLAAAMPNSGGSVFLHDFEDPSHIPSVITAHGGTADKVIIAFADTSKAEDQLIADNGGFAVDCDHGGGHCGDPPELVTAQWQFLKDHPFGVSPDPYASGLPSSFPAYCTKY